ncbi:hypothetical protein T458_26360 [Brevibacillus panacihumi W25]|uniref:Uncharacterized protein n=1 Tax=Brevibacillus panacihumi W25 TaxID=1408254 RepID=V6MA21_9BACL|nr:hypothetical protein T458_26360 [Brevibacillus panacihumi W25]
MIQGFQKSSCEQEKNLQIKNENFYCNELKYVLD